MKLLVLSGGFGSRLKSVLADVPKALAPIGGTAFLSFQISNWKRQGINSFVFLLHHKAEVMINFLRNEKLSGDLSDCEVSWVIEPLPMLTGGAIANAVEQLGIRGNFLVTNADTWLGRGFVEVYEAKSPAMALIEVPNTGRYGNVQVDEKCRITAFNEKDQSHLGAGWINAGLYQLNADTFRGWDHSPFSLEKSIFPNMVLNGKLNAVLLKTEFIDIGVPDDYYKFCSWITSDRKGGLHC